MGILDKVYKINWLRNYAIGKKLDLQKSEFMERAMSIENSFTRKLFCQVLTCCRDDICDFFCYSSAKKKKGIFFETGRGQTVIEGYRYMVFYEIVMFSNDKAKEDELFEAMNLYKEVFCPTEDEGELFMYLAKTSLESKQVFEMNFMQSFIKKVLKLENISSIILAFVNDFFYNSYEGFNKSFTHYVPLDSKSLQRSQ